MSYYADYKINKAMQICDTKVQAMSAIGEIKAETAIQMAVDACTLAANDVFQMGPGRAKKFAETVDRYLTEFRKAATEEANIRIDYKGRETVEGDIDIPATFDQIDRRLKQIVSEKDFVPYNVRYKSEEHQAIIEDYRQKLRALGVKV